jgi:hypothetical protein
MLDRPTPHLAPTVPCRVQDNNGTCGADGSAGLQPSVNRLRCKRPQGRIFDPAVYPHRAQSLRLSLSPVSPQKFRKSGSAVTPPTSSPRTKRHNPAFGGTAAKIALSVPYMPLRRSGDWQPRTPGSRRRGKDPLTTGRSLVRAQYRPPRNRRISALSPARMQEERKSHDAGTGRDRQDPHKNPTTRAGSSGQAPGSGGPRPGRRRPLAQAGARSSRAVMAGRPPGAAASGAVGLGLAEAGVVVTR